MSSEFPIILFLAAFGVAASVPMLIIPFLFAPKKPTPIKLSTFESGQVPTGEAKVHLLMQYYAYLIMFAIFDVMVMFLFAWGVAYVSLGLASAVTILTFLATIFIPMAYALRLAGKRELW